MIIWNFWGFGEWKNVRVKWCPRTYILINKVTLIRFQSNNVNGANICQNKKSKFVRLLVVYMIITYNFFILEFVWSLVWFAIFVKHLKVLFLDFVVAIFQNMLKFRILSYLYVFWCILRLIKGRNLYELIAFKRINVHMGFAKKEEKFKILQLLDLYKLGWIA